VQINPRTTPKDLVKMLEETGTKVSISTVLYRHNLKGRSARKKPLLQNRHINARLGLGKQKYNFAHNDHRYVWRKKGEACKPKTTILTVKHGWQHHVVGHACCRRIDGIMR
jgi:hypothetical protein